MHTAVTVRTVCSCVPPQGDDAWAIQFPPIGLGYICCIIYVCIGTNKITGPYIVFMHATYVYVDTRLLSLEHSNHFIRLQDVLICRF